MAAKECLRPSSCADAVIAYAASHTVYSVQSPDVTPASNAGVMTSQHLMLSSPVGFHGHCIMRSSAAKHTQVYLCGC
jgi:hypothetical protein